jgi:hypothetical protein
VIIYVSNIEILKTIKLSLAFEIPSTMNRIKKLPEEIGIKQNIAKTLNVDTKELLIDKETSKD